MSKCPMCSMENDNDAIFCYYCGTRISNAEVKQAESVPDEHFQASNNNASDESKDVIKTNENDDKDDIAGVAKQSSPNNKKVLTITISVSATIIVLCIIAAVLFKGGYLKFGSDTDRNAVSYDADGYDENYGDAQTDLYETEPPMTEQTEPETTEVYTEETTTEVQTTESIVPVELNKYIDGLVEVNKNYQVRLSHDDWKINIRSSPKFINIDKNNNNIVGLMQSGTVVYAEYIYDGKWIVFKYDGDYAFASIYEKNDPSLDKLIFEV